MIADIVFIILAGLVLTGGIIAVSLRNVFYNALGMGLSFFGLAGLFIFLNSEFLAAMQVIIYIGAIAIAIIFAIMMSPPMWRAQDGPPRLRTSRSILASVVFFLLVARILLAAKWPSPAGEGDYSAARIGALLLGRYVLPFELVSLVLLVAIIGALVLLDRKRI